MYKWLCWHVSGFSAAPYPCLWPDAPPSGSTSSYARIVRQRYELTAEDRALLPTLEKPLAHFAEKYPYVRAEPLDAGPKILIVSEVTTVIVNRTEET